MTNSAKHAEYEALWIELLRREGLARCIKLGKKNSKRGGGRANGAPLIFYWRNGNAGGVSLALMDRLTSSTLMNRPLRRGRRFWPPPPTLETSVKNSLREMPLLGLCTEFFLFRLPGCYLVSIFASIPSRFRLASNLSSLMAST